MTTGKGLARNSLERWERLYVLVNSGRFTLDEALNLPDDEVTKIIEELTRKAVTGEG